MVNNTYRSFKYSKSKYGATANTNLLLWGITVDWNADGNPSNIADQTIDLKVYRGREFFIRLDNQNVASGFQPVRPGTLSITLDDPNLIYDPNNTDSPLYPTVEPGAEIRVFVRPATGSGYKYLFAGEIIDVQSYNDGDSHKVRIKGIDDLQKLSDLDVRSSIEESKTLSELANLALDKVSWPYSKRRIESSAFIVPYWWESRRAFTAINDLSETEGGYFFADAQGNIAYYSQFFQPPIVIDLDESELLKSVVFSRPWESVRNIIRAISNPVALQSEQDIWTLSDTPVLATGESRTIWASFTRESSTVGALDVVAPVATTDYTANSAADGSGTDLTADVSVSLTAFSQSAKITVFNDATSPAFITLLKVRGKPLVLSSPLFSEVSIPPGNRLFASDTRWRQTSTQANDFVNWASFFLPSKQAYPVIKLENRPDKQFEADLFDRVRLDMPSKKVDNTFVVGSIEHRWLNSNGQAVETTLKLEPNLVVADVLEKISAEQSAAGTGHHINYGNIVQINNLTTRTMAGWIYPLDTTRTANMYFLSWNDTYILGYNAEFERIILFTRLSGNMGVWVTPDNSVKLNTWQHVTVTHNRTTATDAPIIYINGVSQVLTTIEAPAGTVDSETNALFSLGNYYHPTVPYTRSFPGIYQDMRVYSRILSSAEALDLFIGNAVDETGLLFLGPVIPKGNSATYLNLPMGTKPVYDLVMAKVGITTDSNYPIIRVYDYLDWEVSYFGNFEGVPNGTLIQDYTPAIGAPLSQSAPGPSSSNMEINNGFAMSAGANTAGATGQFTPKAYMTATVNIPTEENKFIGFVFRYQSEENYILARVYTGFGATSAHIAIVEVTALVETELAKLDIPVAPGANIIGLQASINNNVISMFSLFGSISATSTAHITSVRHGFFVSGGSGNFEFLQIQGAKL